MSILPKTLFLNFDVRNGSGAAIPLLTSDFDSRLSTAALLAILEESGASTAMFTKRIVRTIFAIVSRLPTRSQAERLEQDIKNFRSKGSTLARHWKLCDRREDDDGYPSDEELLWDRWLGQSTFTELLMSLALNFAPVISVNLDHKVHIVKYRYVDSPIESARKSIKEWLGVRKRVTADVPAIRLASRTHTRIEAPDGLIVGSVELVNVGYSALDPVAEYHLRALPDRVVLYTSGLPPGSYRVRFSLRPSPVGLLRQTRYIVLAMSLIGIIGGLVELLWRDLDNYSIVIMLLLPGYLVALLWRSGEHEILGEILRRPRTWVSFAFALHVLAAAALAWKFNDIAISVLWFLAGAFSLIAFIVATTMSNVSKKLIKDHLKKKTWSENLSVDVTG